MIYSVSAFPTEISRLCNTGVRERGALSSGSDCEVCVAVDRVLAQSPCPYCSRPLIDGICGNCDGVAA